jgi:hypothetical protein
VPRDVLIPWWEALELRDEIRGASGVVDDVQASLYRVVYGTGAAKPLYAKTSYYGQITHPTSQLVDLLTKIAIRLGGGTEYIGGAALTRLDQGMGGGKSHACIGAWHLATNPEALAREDLGREVLDQARAALGRDLPRDLNNPHVVVLSCDNMTPGVPDTEQDGPWAYNLYERFLWRLFDGLPDQFERYENFKPHYANKAKIGEAIASLGRPVLIIIDEILNYVGDGLEGTGNPQLIAQDMAFLRALTETVRTVPNTSMLVVMINSEKDPTTLRGDGESRRDDLQAYLRRNGATTSVNENADFSAILRRRLFAREPTAQVLAETAAKFQPILTHGNWKTKVFGILNASWTNRFADEAARNYPFHPQLMELAEREWANLAGFQQVRSTIKIFAATVYALTSRARNGDWVPLLIGPGDLPLSDAGVRDAIIGSGLITDSKTQGNYRSIAQSDIVNLEDSDGAARRLDLCRKDTPWAMSNPRAAERAATMIYLTSIVGARGGSRRGASDPEVKAATVVPDPAYDYSEADVVVRALTDVDDGGLATLEIFEGRGGQPRRYYLSTRQRLPMLIRAMRNTVTDMERDRIVARCAEQLLEAAPFDRTIFVRMDPDRDQRTVLVAADLDLARTTRLIALDPAMFTLGNGTQQPTLDAVAAVLGAGQDKAAVEWASSAVFAVASARSRVQARRAAADYLACERVLEGPEVQEDSEMLMEATSQLGQIRGRLREVVQRSFQHVLYLAQPDPTVERQVAHLTLEKSTLSGAAVWEALAKAQKVFRPGEFTSAALLHNLRDSDYQRPLSEVRDGFWNAPRLGLLPDGVSDLRQAIYQAVEDDQLRIVRAGDETVLVTAPTEINFNAPSYRLAKPLPKPGDSEPAHGGRVATTGTDARHGGGGTTGSRTSGSGAGIESLPGAGSTSDPEATGQQAVEQRLAFTVMKNLASEPAAADKLAQMFRRLYDILDRGSVTYLSVTLQASLPASQAQEFAELAQSLGVNVTIRDH